ncbi:DsbA family protein [Achromobacter dolens]|uniref:DsbA family protein n=1 Tax=Achromobacter dolens TaxID=1287738 RepID=UPI000E31B073|nr:DsbA family protein [Achromobacter dolens]
MEKTLHYLFDPLCGWCYGAGRAVAALADVRGLELRLLPTGLFSGEGARLMDDDFAAYAWSNDQRIEQLTGQPFTERYRLQILGDRQQVFDSGPATVALTAVSLTAPDQELAALTAIQEARNVEGRDITALRTLVAVLQSLDLEAAAGLLSRSDATLIQANRVRIAQAQSLMQQFGARGVPTFILEKEGHRQLLPAGTAFSNPQAFVSQLVAA